MGRVKQKRAFKHMQNVRICIIRLRRKVSPRPLHSIVTFYTIQWSLQWTAQPDLGLSCPHMVRKHSYCDCVGQAEYYFNTDILIYNSRHVQTLTLSPLRCSMLNKVDYSYSSILHFRDRLFPCWHFIFFLCSSQSLIQFTNHHENTPI